MNKTRKTRTTKPKRRTILESESKRRLDLLRLLEKAEAYIKNPHDTETLRAILNTYDGREVLVKTKVSKPAYIPGILVSDLETSLFYEICSSDNISSKQPYSGFLEMIVLKRKN